MFRSGSTLLMRVLGEDPEIKHIYCEPLHRNIKNEAKTLDHYAYFNQNPELQKKWSKDFSTRKLYLPGHASHSKLEKYLNEFVSESSLTKFVRLPLRSNWVANRFSQPLIIQMIRDPRAFCNSMLKERNADIFKPDCIWSAYQAKGWYIQISKHPRFRTECIRIQSEAPYVKILYLWKICVQEMLLSELEDGSSRIIHFRYEDLILDPNTTLSPVYSELKRPVPVEVLNEFTDKKNRNNNLRKWEQSISSSFIEEWKNLDHCHFEYAIELLHMRKLMRIVGYE